MSRSRRRTALNMADSSRFQDAMRDLYQHMQCTIPQPVITHVELLGMFAPPEVVDVLVAAPLLGATSYYYLETSFTYVIDDNGDLRTVAFYMRGDRQHLPMVPKKPVLQPGHEARANEIIQWSTERAELSWDWGLVVRTFTVLNDMCTSPSQLRYVWPPLLGVMRAKGGFEELVESISEFKRPAQLPTFSPEFREVCQRTAQIITTALIMKDIVQSEHPDRQVELNCTPVARSRLHPCKEIGEYLALTV